MEKEEIDFLIIDGDSFIHRAYHGYKAYSKNFANESNFAIKGFTEMLARTINKYESKYLAIVLDHQGISFRKEIYPEYKANRSPKEEKFLKQISSIHDFVKSSGLPYFCIEGVEGDDTIGVLTKKSQSKKWKTVILSGDKDLAQVIDENTKIIDTKTDKVITINNIKEVFGVKKPKQIIDFLALQGDKADNILGMDNCGQKTALKLIEKYNSINELIESDLNELYDYIKPVVRNKHKAKSIVEQVKNNKEQLLLWRFLTSLKLDIPMETTLKDIKIMENRIDFKTLNNIRSEYNLNLNYSLPNEILKKIRII